MCGGADDHLTSAAAISRLTDTVGGSGYCPQITFDHTANRITKIGSASVSYDASGDMTSDGTHTYQWDAEGRMESIDSGSTATYTFNALGEHVGSERILFGSDIPYLEGAVGLGRVLTARIPSSAKEAILRRNFLRLLGEGRA